MTKHEYDMNFYEWANAKKNANVELNQNGYYVYSLRNSRRAEIAHKLYFDEWEFERSAYRAEQKEFQISNALMVLKAHGLKACLANQQNACIKVMSKHGRPLTYYATTGTIAGYGGTNVNGLQRLIEMCEE